MDNPTPQQLLEQFIHNPPMLALADDIILIDHAQARTYTGRAAAEILLCNFFTFGFTHAQIDAPTLTIDNGTAVLKFTFHGRQTGSFLGIAPTGRAVAVPMVLTCGIRDGQVWRANLCYDAGTLLRQLGLAL